MGNVFTGIGAIDYPEDILTASDTLQFGSSVFGTINRIQKQFAAGCYMRSPKATLLWGPVPIAIARQEQCYRKKLELMLTTDFALGYRDQIDAVLLDAEMAFRVYAEGLIVDNELFHLKQNLYRGRIFLMGRVWKLLVDDNVKVFGSNYTHISVDRDLNMLD